MIVLKLFHLLKKDVLLVQRSKVWTFFEVLFPLLLIVVPCAFVRWVIDQKKSHGNMPDEVMTSLQVPGLFDYGACPSGDSGPYYDDRPVDFPLPFGPLQFGQRIDRKELMKKLRNSECSSAYVMETNFSSTFIINSIGSFSDFGDINLQYYVTKLFYAAIKSMSGSIQELQKKISDSSSLSITSISNFESAMYSMSGKRIDLGQMVILLIPYVYVICLMMPVLSLTRNVLQERDTVKPYLSTIGLPVWLFYVEHFTFGVLKTSILITATSFLWVALIDSFPAVIMVGVLFYTLNAASFAIFFSTLLPSPKRAIEGILLIWLASGMLSFLYVGDFGMTWLVSLNVNHAFGNFVKAVSYKMGPNGVSFGDLFSSRIKRHQCAAVYLGYMAFNTVWMLLAAIFMEQALGATGNLIMKQLWGRLGKLGSQAPEKSGDKTNSKLEVGVATILKCEEKSEDRAKATADIELNGLVKVYTNGERAVNGLSLRALRGQVSILLGHNGCGKSTTFGMITGIHKPTAGNVVLGGVDANSDRAAARKLVGYCPQYNPLYDKLTVMEHLKLANALKGCDGTNLEAEALDLLDQIGLTDKKDVLSKNLSGGMKRKLCVCMAMIGGSRVILLDEPTAGMDPAARIDVQKMLMKVKESRTILLTTHYMDEAEKLGDWVFVMSHGKMAASGSIHYLKQKYGDGMMLTLVFKNTADLKKCYETGYEVAKTFIPDARVKDERGQMVEISMPETEKSKLPALLQCLEAIMESAAGGLQTLSADLRDKVKSIELVTIGVSMSSLEQVFIRIGDECDLVIDHKDGETKKANQRKRFLALLETKSRPAHTGVMSALLCIVALLEKRAYYLYRNILQIIFQIILPLAIMWYFGYFFAGLSENTVVKEGIEYVSLDLSQFDISTVVVQMENDQERRVVKFLETFDNFNVVEEPYTRSLNSLVKEYGSGLQVLGMIVKVRKDFFTVLYVEPDTSMTSRVGKNFAIAINLLLSIMSLNLDAVDELPHISSQVILLKDKESAAKATIIEIILGSITFALIISSILIQSVIFLIEERVCKFLHQQLLTGLPPAGYWGCIFLWDFMLYSIIVLYTMIFVWSFGAFQSYSIELMMLLYFLLFCMAPVIYLISQVIASPSKGSLILFVFMVVGFSAMGAVTVGLAGGDQIKDEMKTAQTVIRFVNPATSYLVGVLKLARMAYSDTLDKIFEITSIWEFDGLVIEMLFMSGLIAVFTLMLCLFSTKFVKRGCFSLCHRKSQQRSKKNYKGFEACTAVNEEEKLIQNVNRQEKTVVIDGLIKDFGKFRAVNGLSVTVGHQECFGMLGANGAGKTTTFDIITGLQYPTGGTVTIDGKNITRNIHIGYCPQFDAMLQQISGRQVLRIMARLQGYTNVNELVEIVLECVGMKEHGNKLVKNCSGGQKRKISVGIALLSRATCIILDEPTAGIDPRARREIWDILHAMREQGKCSIILTSHSMEECEALCTRIGVLRTGEMIALGTSQSLKSQYGNTYMMTLIVHKLADREAVSKMVSSEMPSAVLKTPESNLTTSLVWELPRQKDDKWSQKYAQVEALAKKANVKDYMLTQASLEDTFIRLNTSD